jgi:hypothetical protein
MYAGIPNFSVILFALSWIFDIKPSGPLSATERGFRSVIILNILFSSIDIICVYFTMKKEKLLLLSLQIFEYMLHTSCNKYSLPFFSPDQPVS